MMGTKLECWDCISKDRRITELAGTLIEYKDAECRATRREGEALSRVKELEATIKTICEFPDKWRGYGKEPVCYGEVGAQIALELQIKLKEHGHG